MHQPPVSLSAIFDSVEGGIYRHTERVLSTAFHGSAAPLLLLTQQELRSVNGMGRKRVACVQHVLAQADLRSRLPQERVFARARVLYGSVAETPVQALLIGSMVSRDITDGYFNPSPAVKFICTVDGTMTIGAMHEILQSSLGGYLELQGIAMDSRRVRDAYDELSSRLHLWEQALEREPVS